jgi:hypothetical protein
MMRDLPVNVIVTALVKDIYPPGNNPNAKPIGRGPSLTTKLASSLCGYMDFVWYLYIDQDTGERKMLTQKAGITYAKTRRDAFATMLGDDNGVITNPNLPEIYELLKASYKEKK